MYEPGCAEPYSVARRTLLVMDATTALAISGPLLLAALVAVAAGAVSFASPCVVPLVPGYLAYLAGLVGRRRRRCEVGGAPTGGGWPGPAALFVAGFTVVFGAILVGVVWLADALVRQRGACCSASAASS